MVLSKSFPNPWSSGEVSSESSDDVPPSVGDGDAVDTVVDVVVEEAPAGAVDTVVGAGVEESPAGVVGSRSTRDNKGSVDVIIEDVLDVESVDTVIRDVADEGGDEEVDSAF